MAKVIKISKAFHDKAAKEAVKNGISPAEQIEYWVKIGQIALDNPHLPIEFIRDILKSKELMKNNRLW
jgi:hypothetical protein